MVYNGCNTLHIYACQITIQSPIQNQNRKQTKPASAQYTKHLKPHISFHGLLPLATDLNRHFGPVFTIHVGSRPHVFISDPALAHQALVLHGSATSDCPTTSPVTKADTIGGAPYGPTWAALRRNLTPHFINPSTLQAFEPTREWAVRILVDRLRAHHGPIHIIDDLYYSMFCLQIASCFGFRINDRERVRRVMEVIRSNVEAPKFRILGYYPKLTRFIFRDRWKKLHVHKRREEEELIPLIRARMGGDTIKDGDPVSRCYLDGLMELQLPEGRGLTEMEMMSLCSTFLFASTELPTCTIQWIMAEVVRNPRVQEKLLEEVKVNNTTYLKALVKEGLRLHPPGHLVIPHRVEEELDLGGYAVPRDAVLNVMLAEIGRDPRVWEDPTEFRPERWMEEKNSKSVTAFGMGRGMCPGREMALLNLECFVGNLVRWFRWEAADEGVDMLEKDEFVMAMKNPLKVKLTYRFEDSESLPT